MFFQLSRSQDLTATPKIGNLPNIRFEKLKADTQEPHPRGKQVKSDIGMARKVTQKYNTRSRVNHVTTFKNTPKMFKMYTEDTSKTHIGTYYISQTDPKKDTITVEPLENHINYETTEKNPRIQRPSKYGCTSMDQLNVQQNWPSVPGLERTCRN